MQENQPEDYNQEPVAYCPHCLSLAIRTMGGTDFCDQCGATDIKTIDILEWEELYRQKYGKDFLTKK